MYPHSRITDDDDDIAFPECYVCGAHHHLPSSTKCFYWDHPDSNQDRMIVWSQSRRGQSYLGLGRNCLNKHEQLNLRHTGFELMRKPLNFDEIKRARFGVQPRQRPPPPSHIYYMDAQEPDARLRRIPNPEYRQDHRCECITYAALSANNTVHPSEGILQGRILTYPHPLHVRVLIDTGCRGGNLIRSSLAMDLEKNFATIGTCSGWRGNLSSTY